MPLMRYMLFVGGALLALLFIVDAYLPAPPATEASRSDTDLSVIRIHSANRWPDRVVFDTSRPPMVPVPAPAVAEVSAPQEKIAAVPKSEVREAFAQLPPTPSHTKRKHKSVAKNYYAEPPRMVFAQQQRPLIFFGNNIW